MYFLRPDKALMSNTTCVKYVRYLLSQYLGGGPLIFGKGDEPILALSGFYPEDSPAVNFLTLMLYMWKKGMLDLPPIAAVPIVNERALRGSPYGIDIYFDFLELKSPETREITAFYHKARPKVVAVFLGGKEFEAVVTTDVAAQTLALRKITPSPHTPEGAAALKYSHGVVFKIPPSPREFSPLLRHVAQILKMATSLPPIERRVVKVEKKDIYILHGGRAEDDGVIIDNDVYIYI